MEEKKEVLTEENEVQVMTLIPYEEIEGIVCEEVKEEDIPEVLELAGEMVKFCHEKGGIGLSAPQIGINKRFFVWLDSIDKWQLAINPRVFPDGNKSINLMERCLSYPGKYFRIKRFKRITAVFYNVNGETGKLEKYSRKLSGDRAWVFQHECDHLDGKTLNTEGEDMTALYNHHKVSKGK
jgi:peptide deformylase